MDRPNRFSGYLQRIKKEDALIVSNKEREGKKERKKANIKMASHTTRSNEPDKSFARREKEWEEREREKKVIANS